MSRRIGALLAQLTEVRTENERLRRERGELAAALATVADRLERLRGCAGAPAAPLRQNGRTSERGSRRVSVEGQDLPLTPVETELFSVLLAHRGEPVSQAALLDTIRSPSQTRDLRALRVHVNGIRTKLDRCPSARMRIRTLHRVGYQLDRVAAGRWSGGIGA